MKREILEMALLSILTFILPPILVVQVEPVPLLYPLLSKHENTL